MVSRLVKVMMQCLKADTTSNRGQRNVSNGNLGFIQGFDFNVHGKLGTTLLTPFTSTITRSSGTLAIAVPSFVPTTSLSVPQGATHYKLVAAGAEVDFGLDTCTSASAATAFLPIDNNTTTPASLSVTVTANTTAPLFQVLGIHFYQDVNGTKYALNSGNFDAVQIVKVDV